mgnify:FL=1
MEKSSVVTNYLSAKSLFSFMVENNLHDVDIISMYSDAIERVNDYFKRRAEKAINENKARIEKARIANDPKARLLAMKKEALFKLQYPNAIKIFFPPIICKNNAEKEKKALALSDWVHTALSESLLNGTTEGELSLVTALSVTELKLSSDLKKIIGAVNKAFSDWASNELDNGKLRVNTLSLSLYEGNKKSRCINWKVRTIQA